MNRDRASALHCLCLTFECIVIVLLAWCIGWSVDCCVVSDDLAQALASVDDEVKANDETPQQQQQQSASETSGLQNQPCPNETVSLQPETSETAASVSFSQHFATTNVPASATISTPSHPPETYPSANYPTGTVAAPTTFPSAGPPNVYPTGSRASNVYRPGTSASGVVPNVYPSGTIPPASMSGMYPTSVVAPGVYPPGANAPPPAMANIYPTRTMPNVYSSPSVPNVYPQPGNASPPMSNMYPTGSSAAVTMPSVYPPVSSAPAVYPPGVHNAPMHSSFNIPPNMPNIYPQSRPAGFPPMEEIGPLVYHQDQHSGWQGGMRNDQGPPSSVQGPPNSLQGPTGLVQGPPTSVGFIPPSSALAPQPDVGPEFHPNLESRTPGDPQDGNLPA